MGVDSLIALGTTSPKRQQHDRSHILPNLPSSEQASSSAHKRQTDPQKDFSFHIPCSLFLLFSFGSSSKDTYLFLSSHFFLAQTFSSSTVYPIQRAMSSTHSMWVASRELLPSPPLFSPFFLHLQQKLLLLLFLCLQNYSLLYAPSNRNMLHDSLSLSLSLSRQKKKHPRKQRNQNAAAQNEKNQKKEKTSKCAAAEKQTFPPLYQSQFPIRPSLSLSHTHTHTHTSHTPSKQNNIHC